jgi:MerR family transcriptional regulator/heat shock protein HspR
MQSYNEPVYLISQVATMLDIHPQTLRQYEKEGLIVPSRMNGRIRLYSSCDIDKIKHIITLTREMGVNLAGVDLVLRYQEKITKLEEELSCYKDKLASVDKHGVVPSNKALVIKKSSYDIIVFEEE